MKRSTFKRPTFKSAFLKLKTSFLGTIASACLIMIGMVMPSNGARALDLISIGLDSILFIISGIMYFFLIYIMGKLATWGGQILVYVAQLTDFTTRSVIIESWNMVRDLSNMFFIVILLFIAFGTLFRVEAYSWKKLLPKMIFAAILVNFSRAIVGVVVDATQVIMLTFVAAVAPATSQGITTAFHLNEFFSTPQIGKSTELEAVNDELPGPASDVAKVRVLGIAVAGMMLGVMVMVEFVYVTVLVGRMAMIWFLTVLSPLGFATMVLPATEKYYKQWWEMLGRYAMIGPMMMFFFWLSLFIAAKTTDVSGGAASKNGLEGVLSSEQLEKLQAGPSANQAPGTRPGALTTDTVVGFLVSTMMLMAGLKMAQDNSSEIGSIVSKASQVGSWVAKAPLKYGAQPLAGGAVDRLYANTGLDLNVVRQFGRVQEKRAELKKKRELTGRVKAGEAAEKGAVVRSWLGAADYGFEHYAPIIGTQGLIGGGARSMLGRAMFGGRGFKNAKEGLATASGESSAAEKDLNSTEEGLRTVKVMADGKEETVGRMSASGFEQEQKSIASQMTTTTDLQKTVGSGTMDLTAPDSTERRLIEQSRSGLQAERATKGTTDSRKAEIDRQIAALDELMAETGTAALTDNAKAALGKTLGDRQKELQHRSSIYSKSNKKNITSLGGKEITSVTALQEIIADQTKDKRDLVKEKQAATKAAAGAVSKLGPVIDYTKTAMQQSLLAESNKQFAGEQNEDVLKDILRSKFNEGDGIDALGVITHAATVGHLNEMMEAMGLSQDVEGMQQLAKKIQALGVSESMVMAGMNQASNAAKGINHWSFAEAVTQENGQWKWRSEDERQHRVYVEASKVGIGNILRNGNRLGIGGYKLGPDGEKQWNPMPAMMKLMAESMPQLVDTAQKGMLNPNLGMHIFSEAGHQLGNVEHLLSNMIRSMHKDITDQGKAFKALDFWKAASGKGAANDFSAYHAARQAANMGSYNKTA